MPLHLVPRDVSAELADARSVLIVTCPVCAPVSLAVEKDAPLVELFKHGIKTGAYEDLIAEMRKDLESRGVRTGVFCAYRPTPTMCLWTKGQHKRLRKRARKYDVALVMGCESAAYTAEQTLAESDCRVVLGMDTTGITNATMKYRFPFQLSLADKALVELGKPPANQPADRH
jgi:hypothetical protein